MLPVTDSKKRREKRHERLSQPVNGKKKRKKNNSQKLRSGGLNVEIFKEIHSSKEIKGTPSPTRFIKAAFPVRAKKKKRSLKGREKEKEGKKNSYG